NQENPVNYRSWGFLFSGKPGINRPPWYNNAAVPKVEIDMVI
ncbi:MAG: hypothetical protein JWR23_939, partial [Mucilaginibacter sp.]|nr:hypothetical protein [Mucilaginibacter sp.]